MLGLRALVFFLVVPGTVLGLIPYLLVGRSAAVEVPAAARALGGLLTLLGVAVIVWCSVDFVRRGRGTPAPYDPPRDLVAVGLYRHVRNPMYLGAVTAVLGEALWTWRIELLAYAAVLAIAYHLFVRFYEEPTLRASFGESYARYCQQVPRWVPRWRGVP